MIGGFVEILLDAKYLVICNSREPPANCFSDEYVRHHLHGGRADRTGNRD